MSEYDRKQLSNHTATTQAGGISKRRRLKTSAIAHSNTLQILQLSQNKKKMNSRRYSEVSDFKSHSRSQEVRKLESKVVMNPNKIGNRIKTVKKMGRQQSEGKQMSTISYLQQLQQENSKRIQQIYKAKSAKNNSIGQLRNNKGPIFNKIRLQSMGNEVLKQEKQPSLLPISLVNHPKDAKNKHEQLSTISQETQKRAMSHQEHKNTTQCKTPEQQSMPIPKFSQFIQTFTKMNEPKNQNKTYLFRKLKNMDIESEKPSVNLFNQNRVAQLKFFSNIDKSSLKVIRLVDGVYYGQVNEKQQKFGKGAIFYQNGRVYEGDFQNNVKQGYGYETYPDGSHYQGQFSNGVKDGKGRFQWSNGEIYDGQWKDNHKHGSGLWEGPNSSSYLGEWKYGTISGFGVLTNQKGQRYEGQFENFNKEGQGTYRFENGERLVGNFHRNQPNGQCEYYWNNGDYYKGNFSNGLRHGKGFIKYNDGSTFEGQFRNDKKCGLGQQHYADGIVYYGNYQNDLRHGYGKLSYRMETYYEGFWLNNQAVIFQQHNNSPIPEDEQERINSVLQNKMSHEKLNKLLVQQKQKVIKAMKSKQKQPKQKVQKFSRKNLLDRLCNPRRRVCRCALKH